MISLGCSSFIFLFLLYPLLFQGCIISEHFDWAKDRLQVIGKNATNPCRELSAGFEIQPVKNANIFVFHKDEHEVIADWLQYHVHIVGFQNVHVIDGDSTNPQVCKLLAMYSQCGVDVSRFNGSFTEKHTEMTNKMRMHNDSFLIPLDTDEFMTFAVEEGLKKHGTTQVKHHHFTPDRELLLMHLNKVPIDGFKYKFHGYQVQYNTSQCEASTKQETYDPSYRRLTHPGFVGPSQYGPFMSKTFYYSKGFISTNQGNHNGLVAHDHGVPKTTHFEQNFHFTEMSMLHFYTSSYHSMRQKFLRGAAAYGFDDRSPCGANMYCSLGKHYLKYNKASHDHYVQACHFMKRNANHASMDEFTNWFVQHAKSFSELIGEELVAHDLY